MIPPLAEPPAVHAVTPMYVGQPLIRNGLISVAISDSTGAVAQVLGYGNIPLHAEKVMRRARMMSASQEMLDALRAMLAAPGSDARTLAAAAIAKAEGRR